MKTVIKKIDKQWLDMIIAGKKKYELRLADFDIEDGDTIRLEEWEGIGADRKPTGRYIEKTVTNVQKIDLKTWLEKQPEMLEKGMYVVQFD